MTNVYVWGTLVRSTAQYAGINGGDQPTVVTLKYRIGGGATQTVVYPGIPIVQDSANNFHADFDTSGWTGPNNLGYQVQWEGTAPVQVIGDDFFAVSPAPL